MTYRTAKMSPAIAVTTMVVFAIVVSLFIAALFWPAMLLVAGFMVAVCVIAYLLVPVGYELSNDRLTVFTHIGSRKFSPVLKCSPVTDGVGLAVRLFGNSGFFGGAGFFWSRPLGFFRIYVTTARTKEMVLVETQTKKIVISPENPDAFIASHGSGTADRNKSIARQEQFA